MTNTDLDNFINVVKKQNKRKCRDVDNLEILNEKNLARLTKVPCISRIFIAISINGVRLIDNMRIEPKLACSPNGILRIS